MIVIVVLTASDMAALVAGGYIFAIGVMAFAALLGDWITVVMAVPGVIVSLLIRL